MHRKETIAELREHRSHLHQVLEAVVHKFGGDFVLTEADVLAVRHKALVTDAEGDGLRMRVLPLEDADEWADQKEAARAAVQETVSEPTQTITVHQGGTPGDLDMDGAMRLLAGCVLLLGGSATLTEIELAQITDERALAIDFSKSLARVKLELLRNKELTDDQRSRIANPKP